VKEVRQCAAARNRGTVAHCNNPREIRHLGRSGQRRLGCTGKYAAMTKMSDRTLQPEAWEQTLGRLVFYSLTVLAVTSAVRVVDPMEASSILIPVQNWAMLVAAAALPAWLWRLARRQRAGVPRSLRFDLQRTFLFLGVTFGVFGAIFSLHAGLKAVVFHYRSALAINCISTLDVFGGLVAPMAAGVALVMLPYISLRRIRQAAKLSALFCILAAAGVQLTIWALEAHAAPAGTPTAPTKRRPFPAHQLT
jgi:hypothetical protein